MALQTAQILMANLQAFCQRNVDNRLSSDLANSLLSLVKSNLDKLTEEVEKEIELLKNSNYSGIGEDHQ